MSYFKQNVNPSKRVGIDGIFLGLEGLLLGISLGLCPREIPRSNPASPRKTPSIPPLLLGLTQYVECYDKQVCRVGGCHDQEVCSAL